MAMTGAGAKMMTNSETFGAGVATTAAGLGITAVSETANLGAGLTSLGIGATRAVVDATNNRGPRGDWNDRLKARRGTR